MKRTTSAGEILLAIDRGRGPTLREQLESELRIAIQTGRLPGGTLVAVHACAGGRPAHLARRDGARLRAADRGRLSRPPREARPRVSSHAVLRGHHTRRNHGRRRAAARYDFRPGLPDVSLFPRRAWLSSLRRVIGIATDDALGYPDPLGAAPRARRAGHVPQSDARHGRTSGPHCAVYRLRTRPRLVCGRLAGARRASRGRRGSRDTAASARTSKPMGLARRARSRGRWRPVRRAAARLGRRRRAGDARPPVPDRGRPRARAPAGAARVGGPSSRGHHRRRLRRRVPLRPRAR